MEPIFIKNFLPIQILNLVHSYCLIKYSNLKNIKLDPQTGSIIYENSDYLMETILDMSTPVVEQNVGKKLWPTYSYFRIYDKEGDLPIHKDRPSCEYTVALCIGCDPFDKPYEIFVGSQDDESDYKYFDEHRKLTRLKIEGKYPMLQNDALIFKGMDKLHWREVCEHDHFITVFLHYVDQEGPYQDFKYDKRKFLGVSR